MTIEWKHLDQFLSWHRVCFTVVHAAAIWFLIRELSPDSIAVAIVWAIGVVGAVWGLAAFVAVLLRALTSMDDLRHLIGGALDASVAAAWLPGAILLLARESAEAVALGLLLVITATNTLAAQVINWVNIERSRAGRSTRMFRSAQMDRSIMGGPLPMVIAVLLLHIGVVMVWQGWAVAGTLLTALATAIWTGRAIAKGAWQSAGKPGTLRAFTAAVMTLVVAILLAATQLRERMNAAGDTASSRPAVQLPALRPDPETTKTRIPTRLIPPRPELALRGNPLVPGVILKPPEPPRKSPELPAFSPVPRIHIRQPLTFQFTGEYHLFPGSSGQIQPGSPVYQATPLDAVYMTTEGGSLETHALQDFRPSLDLTNCSRLLIRMTNADRSLGSATVSLSAGDGFSQIGSDIFGLAPGTEEELDFPLPAHARIASARAIRISYRLADPSRRNQSMRVAVRQISFIPDGWSFKDSRGR